MIFADSEGIANNVPKEVHVKLIDRNFADFSGSDYYRFDEEIRSSLSFDERIWILPQQFFNHDIESVRKVFERSDGSIEEYSLDPEEVEEIRRNNGADMVIDAYKNQKQVQAYNFSDVYYDVNTDEEGNPLDGKEILPLSIPYPQMTSKYQGLVPLLKKFIREDLSLSK